MRLYILTAAQSSMDKLYESATAGVFQQLRWRPQFAHCLWTPSAKGCRSAHKGKRRRTQRPPTPRQRSTRVQDIRHQPAHPRRSLTRMATKYWGRPLVYLAAPYSVPDPVTNTHRVIRQATELIDAGCVTPFVPH